MKQTTIELPDSLFTSRQVENLRFRGATLKPFLAEATQDKDKL